MIIYPCRGSKVAWAIRRDTDETLTLICIIDDVEYEAAFLTKHDMYVLDGGHMPLVPLPGFEYGEDEYPPMDFGLGDYTYQETI